MLELLLATSNAGKIKEFQARLQSFGDKINFKTLKDYPDLVAPIEDGATFEENALLKAKSYFKQTGLVSLADDSGLRVDALGGKPGIYSARFAGPHASNEDNNQKLLRELKNIPENERGAQFVCSLVLHFPDGEQLIAMGQVKGKITTQAQGTQGFGYDPLFYIPELGKTMAEISIEEKMQISHRGKAFEDLLVKLKEMLS